MLYRRLWHSSSARDLLLEELAARHRLALPPAVLAVGEHLCAEVLDLAQLLAAVAVVDRLGRASAEIEHPAQRAEVAGGARNAARRSAVGGRGGPRA